MTTSTLARAALLPFTTLALVACGVAPPTRLAATPAPAAVAAMGALVAFPGAEGAGRFATGGRGGRVLVVTNLNDAGPGSLRAALDGVGPRTVVFALSGTIALASPLRIRHGQVTIAGQTAPGDGITLRNHALSIAADDVIVRFIRSRLGDEAGVDDDALNVASGQRIIIDHVSTSWSTDETLSVAARFDKPENRYDQVTVQWSIIAESLNCNLAKKGQCHGFGTLLRGGRGSRLSMHHNLWAHHHDRMPRPGNYTRSEIDPVGSFYDFRSNVFYNWGKQRAGYNMDREGTRAAYNFIDNAYVTGPSSKGALAFEESNPDARAFFAGNAMNGVVPADPYSLVVAHKEHLPGGLSAAYRLAQPLDLANVRSDAPDQAYRQVLVKAGASLVRDAVDQRILTDVRQRSGKLINSQSEVGGWPVLQTKPAPLDSDLDGMPDAWERAHGLNPQDASDGAITNPGTGYTFLEDYLASLVEHLTRAD